MTIYTFSRIFPVVHVGIAQRYPAELCAWFTWSKIIDYSIHTLTSLFYISRHIKGPFVKINGLGAVLSLWYESVYMENGLSIETGPRIFWYTIYIHTRCGDSYTCWRPARILRHVWYYSVIAGVPGTWGTSIQRVFMKWLGNIVL